MNRVWTFGDQDRIAVLNVEAGLAVEGQDQIRGALFGFDQDAGAVRDHQRPVGKGKGANGCHDNARHLRVNNRPAGGHRIGGGAGGRGYNQTVGPEGGQIVVIDVGGDQRKPGQGPGIDHDVV